jgi:hypothetical protein
VSGLEKLLAALAVLPFGLGFSVGGETPPVENEVVFAFADPEIIESSGLVVQSGLFATVNDSGDTGRVFTVDPDTGNTVAVTEWDGEPEDVEAIAPLPDGDLVVGDIGDNNAERESVELVRVPFGEDGEVEPTTYELMYPDGAHDAEALLVHPDTGQVMVVAKEFIGRLYAAPTELDEDDPNQLELLGEVLPLATDGAFFPDGKHFVLRGYSSASFYRWPSLNEVGEVGLPYQQQGEGIAVGKDGAIYVSSEGEHSEVLRIGLPRSLRAELEGTADDRPANGDDQPVEDDVSAEGEPADEERSWWPWALGGAVGVVILLALLRSLRPR